VRISSSLQARLKVRERPDTLNTPPTRSNRIALLLAAVLCLITSLAHAQTTEIESRVLARRMADEGATLYESGQYEEARELFHRANSLYPAPALELWEARSLNKLGRLVEAEERYASVKRYRIRPEDSEVVRAAVAEAAGEVDKLRKRIPTVTIQLRGAIPTDPSIVVYLAGRVLNPALIGLPIPTDPSAPTITLEFKGVEIRREVVVLKEGERQVLLLDATQSRAAVAPSTTQNPGSRPDPFSASRSPAPKPWFRRRDVGWIVTGLGVTSLAVGVTTGLIAVGKHDSLSQGCPNQTCSPAYSDDLNSFRTYRTISTLGYVVGAIGLGTGITILALSPRNSTPSAAATLSVSANMATLGGRF
jgi:hypothetical protein